MTHSLGMAQRCLWELLYYKHRRIYMAAHNRPHMRLTPRRCVWCHRDGGTFSRLHFHNRQKLWWMNVLSSLFSKHKDRFAWCIYIGSLSLSHLCSVLALSYYYLKEHWILKLKNIKVITSLPDEAGGSWDRYQHTLGFPCPAVMFSCRTSSSKATPSTFASPLSYWHYHLWLSVHNLKQHISHAVFALRTKKKLSKFVGDESASFIASSFICSQSKPNFQWGSGKWRRLNEAQSEKTLPCFHWDLFDVAAAGELDIISCPSSKRHQTRCCIQNQITEAGPKYGKCVSASGCVD